MSCFYYIIFSYLQLNYGGRVTDDKDRRCITKILELYYCEDLLTDPTYKYRCVLFEMD